MAVTVSGTGTYHQELTRSLSLSEVVFLTLSTVSPASSVFIYSPVLIASLGGASVVAILIAAAVAACMAMCYGELAARYPIAGGEYTWAARLLGRPVGFVLLLLTLLGATGVGALLAAGAGEYLAAVWPALPRRETAVLVIVCATIIAMLKVRTNAWITGGFLAVELLVLVALTVLGLMHPSRGVGAFVSPQVVDGAGVLSAGQWRSLTPLVPVALLMLGGFQSAVYFAEETIGATRQLGRAILMSLAASVVTQLVPLGAVIVGAVSLSDLMTTSSPISDFVRERGGRGVSIAMSLGVALAIVNALIVAINVWARILFASARDRSWPDAVDRLLTHVHVRFGTPVPATAVIGAAAVAASFLPFAWLVTAISGVGLVQFGLVGASAVRVRGLKQQATGGYRMPAWPLPPLALIVVTLGLLYQLSQDTPSSVAASLAIAVFGVLYYYAFIHPRRKERWTLPDAIIDDRR